jgi:hypothetical protein
MTPIFASNRLDWASAIGLFIINYGTLELHILNYLESILSPQELVKFKDRHFRDRVERICEHVRQPGFSAEKREEFEKLFRRLEPIRELRNHIAHGLMLMTLAEDQKTWTVTLSLPRDMAGTNSPEARHLSFAELRKASTDLTDLTEDFKKWDGNWVTGLEVRF